LGFLFAILLIQVRRNMNLRLMITLPILSATLPSALPALAQDNSPQENTSQGASVTTSPEPTPAPSATSPGEAATADSAEEPEMVIVITPTRNPRPLAESTAAVSVITSRQIEQKQAFDITDVLRLVPSLNVAQSGSRGKQASVFLRGASPGQTLVLMDGVRVNSPSFGSFDFGLLSVDNIERIEVLRGPQSGLYGADAIGGVINIITKRGIGPLKTGGRLEVGSDSTNRESFYARGEAGRNRVTFSASRLKSGGIRANDDYRSIGASLRVDRALSEKSNLAFIGRFDDANLGAPGQVFGPDPNERADPRSFFGSLQFTNDTAKRRDKITFGIYDRLLKGNDPANPGDTFFGTNRFSDKVLTLDAQSAFTLGRHTLTAGAEYRRQRASVDNSSNFGPTVYGGKTATRSVFLQDEFKSGKTAFAVSTRYEDNSQFGGDLNGRIAATHDITSKSRLKAAIGTGFQAPTVDLLYSPFGGNPNLKPVENVTYEVGYVLDTPRGGSFEANVFRTRYKNLIGTDALFNYLNVDTARGDGLELRLDQPLGNGFRAIINQSFLNISSTASRNIVRRPKYTTAADLLYRRDKTEFDLGVISVGRRFDVGQAGTQIFGGFTCLDFSVGYNVRPGLKVYARLQNILDREYEEVTGYPAQGRNFVIGLQTGIF
jgi:vitamin B12 transporter